MEARWPGWRCGDGRLGRDRDGAHKWPAASCGPGGEQEIADEEARESQPIRSPPTARAASPVRAPLMKNKDGFHYAYDAQGDVGSTKLLQCYTGLVRSLAVARMTEGASVTTEPMVKSGKQPSTDTEATSRSKRGRSSWLQLLQVGPRTVGLARQAQRTEPGRPVPTLGRSPWPLVQAAVDDMFLSVGRICGQADARKPTPIRSSPSSTSPSRRSNVPGSKPTRGCCSQRLRRSRGPGSPTAAVRRCGSSTCRSRATSCCPRGSRGRMRWRADGANDVADATCAPRRPCPPMDRGDPRCRRR